MENDPDELHNRVNDPSLRNVREELLEEPMSRLLSRMNHSKLSDNSAKNWDKGSSGKS
jgi:hypothetical protein